MPVCFSKLGIVLLATYCAQLEKLSTFSSGPLPPPPLLCAVVFGWQASTDSVEPATAPAPATLRKSLLEILFARPMTNLLVSSSYERPTLQAPLHLSRGWRPRGSSAGRAPASPRREVPQCTGCCLRGRRSAGSWRCSRCRPR